MMIYKDVGVNGGIELDRWHITHGDAKKAMVQASIYAHTLSTTVVMKAKRGPFGGAGFLGSLSDCLDHWKEVVRGRPDPVFNFFYPWISEDLGQNDVVDYGSANHKQQIFDIAVAHPIVKNVGAETKHARWFAWFKAFRETLSEGWSVLCMAIWWPSPDAMEAMGAMYVANSHIDVDADSPQDDGALTAEAKSSSMKASAEEIKLKRGMFSHTLQFSGMVLINRKVKYICDIACYLIRPAEEYQAIGITQCKTTLGLEHYYVCAASGFHLQVLQEIVERCVDVLSQVKGLRSHVTSSEDSHKRARSLATTAFRLMLGFVSMHFASRSMYTHGLPFRALQLLSKDPGERQSCLTWLESVAKVLGDLEKAMAVETDGFYKSVHKKLVWPSMQFPREMLLLLESCEFAGVPVEEVQKPLREFATSWGGTKVI
ncbi:unnamed protein product [Prorocentrum cordatum]|uniref:Uncharacterized protein n=1 Tax=Prorocentrum cordatum TaxID=2364126 RepID=A0ABN9Q829_9DINO|nr:unnamed protein product [Polarella glacialis]